MNQYEEIMLNTLNEMDEKDLNPKAVPFFRKMKQEIKNGVPIMDAVNEYNEKVFNVCFYGE